MDRIQAIAELTNAFGPPGFEDAVVEVIAKHAAGTDLTVDPMNNVYARLQKNSDDRPVVMLDAHTDEVGFMVQSINAKGLISFLPLGGWVTTNIPAHPVVIKNSKGQFVKGITTSRPPHFMSPAMREKNLALEDIFIDVGATSREEVVEVFGIQPGDPIVPDVTFSYNEETGIMLGKCFDNRMGCLCILEVMDRLREENLSVDVVGAYAAQEEVGTRGAEITARTVQPDLAIVFEGSPADDVYYDQFSAQGCLRKGTQIRHMDRSMISNPNFIAYAKELAETHGIPYQSAVRAQGSTNAGKIHLANQGVPTLVLGIPVRYAHTHYGYSSVIDIDATVDLAAEVIKNLTADKVKELLRQK